MTNGYVRHSLDHLRFAVYDRPLDTGLFNILRQSVIVRDRYSAGLWVIGSSHVMNVVTRSGSVAEVLTSSQPALPVDGMVELIDTFEGQQQARVQIGACAYTVQTELRSCSEKQFESEEAEALSRPAIQQTMHRFPENAGLVTPPLTVLNVLNAGAGRLEVETFHSYAEELAVVWTHTEVAIADE